MNELAASLRTAGANAFLMYFKAHSYHWNVEGIEFNQFHDFFGDLYEDIYDSVDPTMENLRKIDQYAPASLMELYNYKTISEDVTRPATLDEMLANLLSANNAMIDSLNKVFETATAAKEQGIANFAADRLDAHKKHGWQIRASLK
jgi:starvation-inducible DNA-binding protein